MPSELLVTAALANCGREALSREVMEEIASDVPGVMVFHYRPRPGDNLQVRAALDWQAVLGTAADLLAFAGAIWAAYERFVKPRRERHKGLHKPFLFLQVWHRGESFVQFTLGNDVEDRDIFIEQFVRQTAELRALEVSHEGHVVAARFESESWVRVQVQSRGKRDS